MTSVTAFKGIIMKHAVHIDVSDHEDMLERLGIPESPPGRDPRYVRVHLFPASQNFFSDPEDWVFQTFQDIWPDWYVEEYDKERMITASRAWWRARVHENVSDLVINCLGWHLLRNCRNVRLKGSCIVHELVDSHVSEMTDDARVEFARGAAVIDRMSKNAKVVYAQDPGTIVRHMTDNASIEVLENAASVAFADGDSVIALVNDTARVGQLADRAKVIRSFASRSA